MNCSLSRHRLAVLALLAAGLPVACNKSFDTSQDIAFSVTVRISVTNSGGESHGDTLNGDRIAISADGHYVAFASDAVDLVSNDSNLKTDVFYHDTIGGSTTLVSISRLGSFSSNGKSRGPSMSSDGRYVCFESTASDLDADDGDTISDVFVRDMQAGTTTLVSRASGTGVTSAKGDGDSKVAFIAANGRYVVFESDAENLDGVSAGAGPDPDATTDIYRRDWLDPTLAFKTVVVSWASTGDPTVPTGTKGSPQANLYPCCSADGRFVTWHSANSNLAQLVDENGPDTNGNIDVFVRDMAIPKTYRASVGTISLGGVNPPDSNGDSQNACISADGRVVAFHSSAFNIIASDNDAVSDVYYYDLNTQVSALATIHSSGSQAGGGCDFPDLSADGRYIVYQSPSVNLVNGDSNGAEDCFIHDSVSHTTSRVSVRTFGAEANGRSLHPAISRDGRYVAFWSEATDMVDGDSNGSTDVFMRGPPR